MNDTDMMIAGIVTLASIVLIPALLFVYLWVRSRFDMPGGWVIVLRVALIAAILVLLAVSSHFGILLGPIAVVIIVFVAMEVSRKHLATYQYSLLWLLTVSAERSIPLAPAVEAFARENRGAQAARARRLARLLDSGMSLAGALRSVPGLVPPDVLPLVLVGCRSNNLAAALRRAATVQNRHDPILINLVGKISYLLLLSFYMAGIGFFNMSWIVPKFQTMFRNFGVELPPVTQRLVHSACWCIDYWFLLDPLLFAGLMVCLFIVLRYFGWSRWDPPGISRLVRRLDSASILDGLALVAGAEKSLREGVSAMAVSHPKAAIRGRLARAAVAVDSGRDWADSLFEYGLLRRADRAVLQAAQRAGNLPWAMAEMADSNRRRFAYRLQAVVQAVFPLAVIGFGLVVMFIVVGLFYPLVELIKKLA
jgi:type II secretory pathway component PulF